METYQKLAEFSSFFQENPLHPVLVLLVVFIGLYWIYYLCVVVKKPRIICKDRGLQRLIERHCPVAREHYWPTWWCFQSHVMTLLRAIIQSHPRPRVAYRSEFLIMPDGGQVKLDWADNDDHSTHPSSTRPTVLLLPGLTGCSEDTYIMHMVHDAILLGYRCVVFNNRGNGGSDLLTPKTFSAANTEDLEFVVDHIYETFPDAPAVGVGVSIGGVILFNYLAASGSRCGLKGAMCISVAWDILESSLSMEKPHNHLFFNLFLTRKLAKKIQQNVKIFEHFIDMDHISEVSTLREFDSRVTAKLFGYESCEHYYKEASLRDKVHALRVPVLTLNAADDPFSPLHAIPIDEARKNDHIAMVVTSRGGHVGFLEGVLPIHKNYMYRWYSQFIDAFFKHGVTKVD